MGRPLPTDDSDDDQDTCVNGIEGFAPLDENEGSFIDDRVIHPENWAMWSEDSDESERESGGKRKRVGDDVDLRR